MKPQAIAFLAKACELLERTPALFAQSVADETGPDSKVTYQQAAAATEAAKLFVSKVPALIAADPAHNSSPAS